MELRILFPPLLPSPLLQACRSKHGKSVLQQLKQASLVKGCSGAWGQWELPWWGSWSAALAQHPLVQPDSHGPSSLPLARPLLSPLLRRPGVSSLLP